MSTLLNSDLNYTGLIQKYIGTAYDKVAAVSDNLELITTLADLIIKEELDDLLELSPDLEAITEQITIFFDTYWGAYPSDPEASPNCTAAEPGDMYFNTTDNMMYVFNGTWVPLGYTQQSVDVITVTAEMIVAGTAVIPIPNGYLLGTNSLFVFTNTGDGNKLEYSTVTDPNGTYEETDSTTISFPNSYLKVNDEVILITGVEVSTLAITVDMIQEIYNTGLLSEQTIIIPNNRYYVPGSGNLEVYVDRRLQIVGLDYTEINNNTIRFNTPLPAVGTEVVFNIGATVSNAPVITTLIQETKPDEVSYAPGTFWLNSITGRVFILFKDIDTTQWISVSTEEGIIVAQPSAPESGYVMDTVFSDTAPDVNVYGEGSRWFKTDTGEEFILYVDVDSRQWLKIYK